MVTGPCYSVGVDGGGCRSFYSSRGLRWSPGGRGVLGTGRLAGLWVPSSLLAARKDPEPQPPCLDVTLAAARTGASCIKTLVDYMTFEIWGLTLMDLSLGVFSHLMRKREEECEEPARWPQC